MVEKLIILESLHGIIMGGDVFLSVCVCVCVKPRKYLNCLGQKWRRWLQTGLQVWLERKLVTWVELGQTWTNKIQNLYGSWLRRPPTVTMWKKNCSLNLLRKFWCRVWTSFDLMDLIIASFNPFCWKLRLNIGMSCTTHKSGGSVGQCCNIF